MLSKGTDNVLFYCVILLSEVEAEEAAELAWTTQRLQQIGAAVAAAAAAAVTAQVGTDEATAAAQDDPALAAAVGSSRAPSQEPPDPNAAASNLLDMAAAAVAGQLVTTAYPGQVAAAAGSGAQQQQQGLAGIDLNLLGLGGLGFGEAQTQNQHLTAEDYQIFLGKVQTAVMIDYNLLLRMILTVCLGFFISVIGIHQVSCLLWTRGIASGMPISMVVHLQLSAFAYRTLDGHLIELYGGV